MSITYKIEICNEKIENFSIFVEEIFKNYLNYDEVVCKSIEDMIYNQSFRETAKSISPNTGLVISCQAVWNINIAYLCLTLTYFLWHLKYIVFCGIIKKCEKHAPLLRKLLLTTKHSI